MLRRIVRRLTRLFRKAQTETDTLSPFHISPPTRDIRKACHIQAALMATERLEGSIVECGVAGAWTLSIFMHAVRRAGREDAIFAVDSYEGFPALSEHDADWFDPETMMLHYKLFDIEFARKNLLRSGLTEEEISTIEFVKGWIPDALQEVPDPIRVLHLDVDLYQSYADSLRILWPQVVPGGWVIFDEYDQGRDEEKWPGAKRAIDDFTAENGVELHKHWSGFTHVVKPTPSSPSSTT